MALGSTRLTEVSVLELAVLQRLARSGPSSPGALASEEGVTSAAVAATLTSLTRRGLVRRERAADDGRRAVVTISAAGRRTLDRRESASITGIEAILTETFNAADRKRLLTAIPLLEKVADRL